ncbi:hypothetical protein Ciccas_013171, partial [Cichlidogyrus casuarinus]
MIIEEDSDCGILRAVCRRDSFEHLCTKVPLHRVVASNKRRIPLSPAQLKHYTSHPMSISRFLSPYDLSRDDGFEDPFDVSLCYSQLSDKATFLTPAKRPRFLSPDCTLSTAPIVSQLEVDLEGLVLEEDTLDSTCSSFLSSLPSDEKRATGDRTFRFMASGSRQRNQRPAKTVSFDSDNQQSQQQQVDVPSPAAKLGERAKSLISRTLSSLKSFPPRSRKTVTGVVLPSSDTHSDNSDAPKTKSRKLNNGQVHQETAGHDFS